MERCTDMDIGCTGVDGADFELSGLYVSNDYEPMEGGFGYLLQKKN